MRVKVNKHIGNIEGQIHTIFDVTITIPFFLLCQFDTFKRNRVMENMTGYISN